MMFNINVEITLMYFEKCSDIPAIFGFSTNVRRSTIPESVMRELVSRTDVVICAEAFDIRGNRMEDYYSVGFLKNSNLVLDVDQNYFVCGVGSVEYATNNESFYWYLDPNYRDYWYDTVDD